MIGVEASSIEEETSDGARHINKHSTHQKPNRKQGTGTNPSNSSSS